MTRSDILSIKGFKWDLSKRPLLMGVLNITPDSFSDGGRFFDAKSACRRAWQIARQGADILDIGGESSRPGSLPVGVDEELSRVLPVIRRVKDRIRIPISVDTSKPEVAESCLREGALIINNITGLRGDSSMARICARYEAGVIIMHMKGCPRTMQERPLYADLLGSISAYLKRSAVYACSAGVRKDSIILDPGIGFGKTLAHNLSIIDNLCYFKKIGYPLAVGVSRKSFLGDITGFSVDRRSIPTAAANAIAVYRGADIIRSHDIKESMAALKIGYAIRGA
ncbi:MAG: dihydropteroate synthase [Candidatus Omnitrophota bacterium]